MTRNSGYIGKRVDTSRNLSIGVNKIFDAYNSKISDRWPISKKIIVSLSSTLLDETENRVLFVSVKTVKYENNQQLFWTIDQISGVISTSDFSHGLSGSFNVLNNGDVSTSTINIAVRRDGEPDGNDQFVVNIRESGPTGPIVGTSGIISVLDTSTEALQSVVSGGEESFFDGYRYHTFTSSGTLEVLGQDVFADILVVGGGGGSSGGFGGGGGAGGYLSGSMDLSEGEYLIVIGSGGASSDNGTNGNNSQIISNSNNTFMNAIGGGRSGVSLSWNASTNGASGGSGGGGPSQYFQENLSGGAGTPGQGNPGGNGASFNFSTNSYNGAGGGGASLPGQNANPGGSGSRGGSGLTWLNNLSYAGGGGGAIYMESSNVSEQGFGGIGGGGDGVRSQINNGPFNSPGTPGEINTGGGAGGGGFSGGSGIVIVRYLA